jgi:AAA family ATP:ADP antiporter
MKFTDLWKKSDSSFRKNLVIFITAYFLVLFNYPLIRASGTAFFFEAYGAKSSPVAMFVSVFFLALSIMTCNRIQAGSIVQKVFLVASVFSGILFVAGTMGFLSGIKLLAYVPFVWKEIYIVLQVHLLLAYANTYFTREEFKLLLGPVGAAGSIGGILGGMLTSYLSGVADTEWVMWTGVCFIFLPAVFFLFTRPVIGKNEEKKKSPLSSLDTPEIRKYVFYVALVVLATQFVINIADFMFHLEFEKNILSSQDRTGYLGQMYSLTNLLTLVFQVVLLPFVLPRVSERNFHLFIPVSYFISIALMLGGSGMGLLPVAALFTYLKAADYSLFSSGKELLYQPLKSEQKYGAKYLTDMLVYRAGKALVALVLIYLQSSTILNMLMFIFLGIWIFLIIKLFKLHRHLFS